MTVTTIENHKEILQQYLLNKVLSRLSGRDGCDIIEKPSKSLYAGVLAPRFTEATENFQEKRQTSSIGIDFRIKPKHGEKILLYIKPKWCIYYSVFPDWKIVEAHNSIQDKNAEKKNRTVLVMPVAFRRKEIVPAEKQFEISNKNTAKIFDFNEDIVESNNEVIKDNDRWHHLGEPKHQVRRLESSADIQNAEDYKKLLENIIKTRGTQKLPEWKTSLHVEINPEITDPSIYRVKILLSNDTSAVDENVEDRNLDERAIFDAFIEVGIKGGEIVPFEFLLAAKDYRLKPIMYAKGINCVVYRNAIAETLITETLPIYDQPLYRAKHDSSVDFSSLMTDEPEKCLIPIADAMRSYVGEWDKYLAKNSLSKEGLEHCKQDRDNFKNEIENYLLGIECLRQDKRLKRSFKLMNKVFLRLGQKLGGKIKAWRLFQICFIVSQLPALMARELSDNHEKNFKEAVMRSFERVGVLWFPTGGGKTEAYLGLIATALIFDRLRGKIRGVNTWMRFPLRMLSLQQMERLASVIAELNILRAEEGDIQIGDPFSIGYYVGNDVTPNNISDKDMDDYIRKEANRKKILILRKCPYCNSKSEIMPDKAQWRILHKCSNKDCFSNISKSLGQHIGSLPIFIVDNEIYRYLPTVLVGTVDKLAIAAFSEYFSHLVKGVYQQCPEHGYTSYDSCMETYSSGCKKTKKSDLTKIDKIKDPGISLLIQDELHLLKSELGVFNGHYEGLLQYIGSKAYLPPKILAATATIESFDQHAFHLYLKESDRFPVPSWQRGETFYATSIPLIKRRKFIGILCHTRSIVDASARLVFIYQQEIKLLKANLDEVRKLLNEPSITDKEIWELLTLYDLSLVYVNKKQEGSNLLYRLEQRNNNLATQGLSKIRHELLTGDRNPEDIGIALERIQNERKYTDENRLDVVAATNLISHGVDLERINMMTICGMPSHYAEYVQSSSRSSRSHPGFIFVCFLSKDLRELSQFEMFLPMHENMDSLIEPVAVNRFASFAPNKTVPGLLAALLINDLSPDLYKHAIAKPLSHVPTLKVAMGLQHTGSAGTKVCLKSDDLLAALEQIIGTDRDWNRISKREIANIKQRINEILEDQFSQINRSLESKLKQVLNPITSFRDVDEGIEFQSIGSSPLVNRV